MAREAAANLSKSEPRRRSRGGRETIAAGEVRIAPDTACPHTRLTLYRSLEDIGKRSLALSNKGKVARAFDKKQDSEKVIGLVETLRQAILIYQVSGKHRRDRKALTRGPGIAATVDIQPSRPFDGEFLLPVPGLETKRWI